MLRLSRKGICPRQGAIVPSIVNLRSFGIMGTTQELWYEDPTAGDKPKTMKQLSGYDWEAVRRKRFGKTVKTVSTVEINMNSKVKNLMPTTRGMMPGFIAIGGDALQEV